MADTGLVSSSSGLVGVRGGLLLGSGAARETGEAGEGVEVVREERMEAADGYGRACLGGAMGVVTPVPEVGVVSEATAGWGNAGSITLYTVCATPIQVLLVYVLYSARDPVSKHSDRKFAYRHIYIHRVSVLCTNNQTLFADAGLCFLPDWTVSK